MRARTRIVVAPGGVLAAVACEPPLTVRRVYADAPDVCALCLVGTAAGPLPGDDLGLTLTVADGAAASLAASAASIAQGRPDPHLHAGYGHPGAPEMPVPSVKMPPAAAVRYDVVVGAGAQLVADPGPLVVAASADVVVEVCVDLAADATLCWREVVVLGRTGQSAGQVVLRWDVRRGGRPLLRQDIDLADDALRGWNGMVAGRKVLTTTLRVGPSVDARTEVRTPTDVTQRLAQGATLTTVLSAS